MADIERILIVGGGIAGLTAATALHRKGFVAELIERERAWPAVGAGIAVQPNGMRVLNGLGVGAAVAQAGAIIQRWSFDDEQGEPLCEIDLDPLWGHVAPFVGIERTKLHQVLVAAAMVAPHRLGISLVSLSQDASGVSVGFSDGSAGEYDLVVGADGISSTVRKLFLSPAAPIDLGAMNYRSVVPIRPRGLTGLRFILGEKCFFGLCPVAGGRTYGFGYLNQPRFYDPVEGRLERLRDRFSTFGAIVQEYLDALQRDDEIICSAMEWIHLEEWCAGRVVLIGDAAHASSPLMGQGGCMAMEDSYVLAEELRSQASLEDALKTYVARRKPRVAWVQQQSVATGENLQMPPAARNTVLRERGEQIMQSRFRPLNPPP